MVLAMSGSKEQRLSCSRDVNVPSVGRLDSFVCGAGKACVVSLLSMMLAVSSSKDRRWVLSS
jgi:hypothetical protein